MVRSRQGVQSEEWLAVLDGRFLPIDEMTLSIERDAQDVVSASSIQTKTVTTAEILNGSIDSRREPALKPNPKQLRLYGPDEEYLIWNLVLDGGMPLYHNAAVEAYVVEFKATDWEYRKR